MKIKKLIAVVLALGMIVGITACGGTGGIGNLETKPAATAATEAPTNGSGEEVKHDPIEIKLTYATKNEKDANIVRDLLTKKGFVVNMDAQADNAGVKNVVKSGDFDIAINASGNSAYSVDYAFKYFIYTGGSLNWSDINDETLMKMIDDSGAAPEEDWDEVYSEIENYMVTENVYSTPLYQESQGVAVAGCVDIDTYIPNCALQYMDYTDKSLRDTRTFKFSFNTNASAFPTMDPIRKTDGVTNYIAPWCYAYLIHVDPLNENEIFTRGTLSQAYSVSEDFQSFYFLLRDDCFFTRIDESGNPVVSDHLVAGEDVCYSILRAANKNSVPGNAASTYFTSVEDCVIVTNIDELKNTKNGEGKSILDELTANSGADVKTLAATRDDVDGSKGAYQVVKITTQAPFSQLLNYLNCSAGIVDKDWVESINAGVDVEKYDADKDWLYGDTKYLYPGADYKNDGSFSGPYVITTADDYGVKMVRNDGFATKGDVEDKALIKNAEFVYTAGQTEGFTALRGGDVDLVPKLANSDIKNAEEDSSVNMKIIDGAAIHFIIYNQNNENSVCSNVLVRKAIQAAINPDDVIAGIGNAIPANSVITVGFRTSHTFTYDPDATDKYLAEYWASK